MSDRPDKLLILDIQDAIEKINLYIRDINFHDFQDNNMIRDAVERNIEIIGEAANRISDDFKIQNRHIEWHKPISMRNRLIHGYFAVDIPLLWNTITVILPPFYNHIKALAEKIGKEEMQ